MGGKKGKGEKKEERRGGGVHAEVTNDICHKSEPASQPTIYKEAGGTLFSSMHPHMHVSTLSVFNVGQNSPSGHG